MMLAVGTFTDSGLRELAGKKKGDSSRVFVRILSIDVVMMPDEILILFMFKNALLSSSTEPPAFKNFIPLRIYSADSCKCP